MNANSETKLAIYFGIAVEIAPSYAIRIENLSWTRQTWP